MVPSAPTVRLVGILAALISAASFAAAGPFGKALTEAGWSVTAVAGVRTGGAALALAVQAVLAWRAARPDRAVARAWVLYLVRYGVLGMAGVQLCFYTALQYAPVAVVLLIEYLAPVLLVGWAWLRTGRPPAGRVVAGALLSMVGLALVIGIGQGGTDVRLLGVVWALAAAVCLACYFRLADAGEDGAPKPPTMVLVCGGLAVGSLTCLLISVVGLVPWTSPRDLVVLPSATMAWWLPMIVLIFVAGVTAYYSGILAVRQLGSRNASFLALTEVLFAALVAWWILGEQASSVQAVGAVVVLTGVALVQAAPSDPVVAGRVSRRRRRR